MGVEQRARELLAAEYERFDLPSTAAGVRAGAYDLNPSMRAVVAALTPPDGFMLVPVEPTEAMIEASMIRVELAKRCGPGTLKVLGARAWDAMLAARPEVKS